jgi:hypothetical protein
MTSTELSGWAYRIQGNLEDSTVSVGMIISWLQNNLYKINISLPVPVEYSISGDSIAPDMTSAISGIYEEMYYCDYMKKKCRMSLGAASYDWVEVDGADQGRIRRVSKNEQAKTWRTLYQDCEKRIDELIKWYEDTYSEYPMADQILYNERCSVSEGGLQVFVPPYQLISPYNSVWC